MRQGKKNESLATTGPSCSYTLLYLEWEEAPHASHHPRPTLLPLVKPYILQQLLQPAACPSLGHNSSLTPSVSNENINFLSSTLTGQ